MSHTHHFHPEQPKQETVSFVCSLPQSKSSIKKVTKALPYPLDISEALDYSSAYIDHAAHLARHGLEQFERLKSAHKELHATSADQAHEIESLKCHVRTHEADIRGLNSKYAELEKQRERDAKAAKGREDLLKQQLSDAQKALKAAEGYIAKDKLEDIKRDNAHHAHISADHLIIKQAEERAVKAEAQVVKLQDLLDTTNQKLAVSESTLKSVREQLTTSLATVAKLTKEIAVEKQEKEKVQAELKTAKKSLEDAKIEIAALDASLDAKAKIIDSKTASVEEKDKEVNRLWAELKVKGDEVNKLEDNHKLEIQNLKDDFARKNRQQAALKTPTANVVELVNVL